MPAFILGRFAKANLIYRLSLRFHYAKKFIIIGFQGVAADYDTFICAAFTGKLFIEDATPMDESLIIIARLAWLLRY